MSGLLERGGEAMDELFTIEEMRSKLKISRDCLYNYMEKGIIPFVKVGGQRRFIGSQVMKAIKTMQIQQVQGFVRNVRKDTLSDVPTSSSLVKTKPRKALKRLTNRQYKHSQSKTV